MAHRVATTERVDSMTMTVERILNIREIILDSDVSDACFIANREFAKLLQIVFHNMGLDACIMVRF